jgi:hypothetical protein
VEVGGGRFKPVQQVTKYVGCNGLPRLLQEWTVLFPSVMATVPNITTHVEELVAKKRLLTPDRLCPIYADSLFTLPL